MNLRAAIASLLLLAATERLPAAEAPPADVVAVRLEQSLAELASAREEIAGEKVPMMERLNKLEAELIDARKAYDTEKRKLDGRSLDMNNLRGEIKTREQEKSYLSNLLNEYIRNFETRLHIAELNRYQTAIEKARLAPENSNLKPAEVFAEQVGLIETSVGRLEELLGGAAFEGRGAGEDGLVRPGTFVLVGPVAYFASQDGALAGVAEQRLGSLEAAIEGYADPSLAGVTLELVANRAGIMPFDGSLGNARKVEETTETVGEHLRKGGAVVKPIMGLAAAVLLLAGYKWLVLVQVRAPRVAQLDAILGAVAKRDRTAAVQAAAGLRGPFGAMLKAGAAHVGGPKELIEEVMFEKMLEARFRLNKGLPFIAVGAACAPLLGLLGTVTGIISTFKLLTVFGSGDIKMLSAGISEALITTELGLLVAIPSIILHAFLSRHAKSLTDKMERVAISFLAEMTRSASAHEAAT